MAYRRPEPETTVRGTERLGSQPPGVVRGSIELAGRRTTRSTAFRNPDGTITERLYSGPAFVARQHGMVPIDRGLVRGSDGRWVPRAAAPASFASTADDPTLARLVVGDRSVAFGIADARPVNSHATGPRLRYADIRPHSDAVFEATGDGIKEELILHSVEAPTTWSFPLRADGLTPELVDDGESVVFRDASGDAVLVVPPGWMEDSNIHPQTGDGAISRDVRYGLERTSGGWVLRVTLDESWLRHPARVFPIVVDPTVRYNTNSDDTYVMSGYGASDSSTEPELKVGTWDGGGHVAASYLHFNSLKTNLSNRYILSASLNLLPVHTYSCSARSMYVHRVTQSWSGSGLKSWPGASYDSTSLASKSFAGPYKSSCSGSWQTFSLSPTEVTKWVHGTKAFHGLRLRASSTDSYGWKRFASANSPVSTNKPYLDVTYSEQGAAYSYPNPKFNPPVTGVDKGRITVRVTNWGTATWTTTNGYRLTYKVLNSSGSVVQSGPNYAMPKSVAPHTSADVPIEVGPLTPGTYKLRLDMLDPNGASFKTKYGVPYAESTLTVANGAPYVAGNYPLHNGQSDSLRPTLWADYEDPDNYPAGKRSFWFEICRGAPENATGCQQSGWISSATWTVPAGVLRWGETASWSVQVSDTVNAGSKVTGLVFTPTVPQPAITAHLAGAPDGGDVPGLNPQVGNYVFSASDASVNVIGPPLEVTRTYNSQDPRSTGAFGAGWFSTLDERLMPDDDGTGNVVVTLASGRQVRFGRNPDGTYTPPKGMNLTLVHVPAAGTESESWVLRDATGSRRTYAADGGLTTITDSAGRRQTRVHDTAGRPITLTDAASGRSLHLTWNGGRVTSVATDPEPGGAALTWRYAYTGDLLTQACSPLSAESCLNYAYTQGSDYQSIVRDANPTAYWPLGETEGTVASNVVARDEGEHDGQYREVTLGQPDALAGSPDTAAGFDAAASSAIVLPDNLLSTSMGLAIELWFRADLGKAGVLFSQQSTDLDATPKSYVPSLYVGTDGKLRGYLWTPSAAKAGIMTTPGRVDDGAWHHVVLTGAVDRQELYLDGQRVGQTTGHLIDHLTMNRFAAGTGYTNTWPATNNAYFPFTGALDELAVYRRPLGATTVAEHYAAARVSASRLNQVVEPGPFTATDLSYDAISGRVSQLRDRHGAMWTLGAPTAVEGVRTVELSSTVTDTIAYQYEIAHGGRLISRTDGFGSRTWRYNDKGFVEEKKDENGRSTWTYTDTRGNVTSEVVYRDSAWRYTYFGYFHNADDPLDPRNDQRTHMSDARTPWWDASTEFRTDYTLDAAGRVVRIQYPIPAGHSTRPIEEFTYSTGTEPAVGGGSTPAGLLLSHKDVRNQMTSHGYNSSGDQVSTSDPAGLTTTAEYDWLGRPTAQTELAGDTVFGRTATRYNALSQPIQVSGPAITNPITREVHTRVTSYTHDSLGRVLTVTDSDGSGSDAARQWRYGYDAAGRPTSVTAPDNGLTTQAWNSAGDLVERTDPGGLKLRFQHDDAHRLTTVTAVGPGVDPQDPAATELVVESRAYDESGRVSSVFDAVGRERLYLYWEDGSLKLVRSVQRDEDGWPTPLGDLVSYKYDAAGNVIDHRRRMAQYEFTYDVAGFVTSEILDQDDLNRTTSYTRDAAGNPLTVSVSRPYDDTRVAKTSYEYDAAGRVAAVTVDNGPDMPAIVSRTERDARGLPTVVRNPNNEVTNYRWDAAGNLVSETQPAVTTWVNGVRSDGVRPEELYGRNAFGEVTEAQDPNQRITRTVYDVMGRPTSVTAPSYTPPVGETAVPTTHTTYDKRGLPISEMDPLGHVTAYDYDLYGRLTKVIEPDPDGDGSAASPLWTVGYTRAGELASITDPLGASWSATYDHLGRQVTTTVSDRLGAEPIYYTTRYKHYTYYGGRLVETHSPLGHISQAEYNNAGELGSLYRDDGGTTRFRYDVGGRLTRTEDPDRVLSMNKYDLAGRLVASAEGHETDTGDVLRPATTHTYDAAGRRLTSTSPEGRRTRYGWDAAGRLTSITGGDGTASAATVQLGYDAAGNRTQMVDGNGNATRYTYNSLGLLESVVEPATAAHPTSPDRTWTTSYDAAGQAVVEQMPGGVVRNRTFDPLGRMVRETGAGAEAATLERRLGYDALGRITSVNGPAGDTTYRYDDRGNLIETAAPGGTSSFTYDADGRLTARTDPTGTATFSYNRADRLTGVSDPLTGASITFGYTPGGRTSSITYGTGGPTRSYAYDPDGQLVKDTIKRPDGTTSAEVSYAYNDDGLLSEKTVMGVSGAGTHRYSYDSLGRLATWTKPGNIEISYGYDKASNRTSITGPDGTRTYTYDERNRLLSASGGGGSAETHTWSPRGTAASVDRNGQLTSYRFDAFERMAQAQLPGTTVAYAYDGLDRLASRNGLNFGYADQSNNPVTVPLDAGVTASILRAPDGTVLSDKLTGGDDSGSGGGGPPARLLAVDSLHGDAFGAIDGATGEIAASAAYSPLGERTDSAGTLPVGFQGGYTDSATGQVNAHARWYDPADGAFTSRDTSTLDPDPVAQANRYAYGNADPLNHTDLDGHRPISRECTCAVRVDGIPMRGGSLRPGGGNYGRSRGTGPGRGRASGGDSRNHRRPSSVGNNRGKGGGSWSSWAGRDFQSGRTARTNPHRNAYLGISGGPGPGSRGFYNGSSGRGDFVSCGTFGGCVRSNPYPGYGPDAGAGNGWGGAGGNPWYAPPPEPDWVNIRLHTKVARAKLKHQNDRRASEDPTRGRGLDNIDSRAPHDSQISEDTTGGGAPQGDPGDSGGKPPRTPEGSSCMEDPHVGAGPPGVGWRVGEHVYNATRSGNEPAWSTVRARYWKNVAADPRSASEWSDEQLSRMQRGRAPQRYNQAKGDMESMELSHEPIPCRDGGKTFVPRWPQDHGAVDPYRFPGY